MEIQTIATEGTRIDKVRDMERLWLEVEAHGNGCSIHGHAVKGEVKHEDGTIERQKTRIEIYLDRLDAVLARTRTDEHRAAWAQAEKSCQILTEQWIEEHRNEYNRKKMRGPGVAEEFVRLGQNHHPSIELARLGYRTGLPPLESCKVIDPRNTERTMDAREWQKLPAEKRREWHVAAPPTGSNQATRQAESISHSMREGLRDLVRELQAEKPKK